MCGKRCVNSNKTGGSPDRVVFLLKIRHTFPIFSTEKHLASVVILATTPSHKHTGEEKQNSISN